MSENIKGSQGTDSKSTNLVLGIQPSIELGIEPPENILKLNTPADSPNLTDGVFASSATIGDSAFFKFCRGLDRRIIFDFGAEREVHKARASFLHDANSGVIIPRTFSLLVSDDKSGWQKIATVSKDNPDSDLTIVNFEAVAEKPVKARYAAVEFNVDCWVFCDEIEIIGCKQVSDDAVKVVPDAVVEQKYPNKYLYPEDFHGIHDIMLFYNCLAKNPPVGLVSKEKILPYVGYVGEDGKIADIFFDSFLFLPFVSNAPSGGFYYDNPKAPGNFSDWLYYVDNVFAKGYNINALNDATGEVKAQTGRDDYKVNVFFSILFPVGTQKNFGSPVDGENLDFTNVEDRKAAIKWLIDEQAKRFVEGKYEHLNLVGFYWFHESVNFGDKQELELISWTTDYVRSIGYKTIWIPFYQASGFNKWDELGFDAACMQPNYAFTKNPPKVVYDCAAAVKKLGMCLEMEIGGTSYEAVDKYNVYLKAGIETGYMNAMHMYYQGGGPGEFYKALHSDDPYVKAVYDNTYKFVKHTLTLDDLNIK